MFNQLYRATVISVVFTETKHSPLSTTSCVPIVVVHQRKQYERNEIHEPSPPQVHSGQCTLHVRRCVSCTQNRDPGEGLTAFSIKLESHAKGCR
jgi:hypothetical protein